MSFEEYSYSFLLLPKMKTATSTEHRTESSCAFLKRPPFLLRKVTERLRSSAMALISIFLLPIVDYRWRRPRVAVVVRLGRAAREANELEDLARRIQGRVWI